jgi:transposase
LGLLASVFEIAPVLLKNEARIEAFFFVYFLALLVQALIERELRRALERARIEHLALYPEDRPCRRPTAEQVFRLFALIQRHTLTHHGVAVHSFDPQLTELQRLVLSLLNIPSELYQKR